MFDNEILHIIEAEANDFKIVVKGPTGCGKTTLLHERYRYMVENLAIQSEKILVLVLNKSQATLWQENMNFKASGRVWISTYYSFLQSEISTYYPWVVRNCSNIQDKSIKPIFLPFEASRYLMAKVIEWHRENKGIFSNIIAPSEKIASDIIGNLLKAAASDIPHEEISSRLYSSLAIKNDEKLQIYEESEKMLDAYRSKCMSLGIFDYGMAMEVYNHYLLKDKEYSAHLSSRVQHLLVDNIEECFPVEVDFLEYILPFLKTCVIGYNPEKGYENGWKKNHKYLEEKLIRSCKTVEMGKSYTSHPFMQEFSEMLFEDIQQNRVKKQKSDRVEHVPVTELRSEMLDKIGERICRLITEEGYAPKDIAVLSTYADPVSEFVISSITQKQNIHVKNISRKDRIVDNEINFCLVILAQLCHPSYKRISSYVALRVLIVRLLGIDPIRASLLAEEAYTRNSLPSLEELKTSKHWHRLKEAVKMDRYVHISQWIQCYINLEKPLPMDRFFYKAFLEIFMSDTMDLNEIKGVSNLIENSERFISALDRFPNMNTGKGLLEVLLGGMKNHGMANEEEGIYTEEFVMMMTPQLYLSGSYNRKIVILMGISSRNWVPRNLKELTNPAVLHKTWDVHGVYTEEMEEENQTKYIAAMMRALAKRCGEKLIVFESLLSANGYENDGILADYL